MSPSLKCPRRSSPPSFNRNASVTTSWPVSARSICHHTVSDTLDCPPSSWHIINFYHLCRQCDNLLPQRHSWQEEGLPDCGRCKVPPRTTVQELDTGEDACFREVEATDRVIPPRRGRSAKGAKTMDCKRLRGRPRGGLQGVGPGAGRGSKRAHGREERDYDCHGSSDGS